MAGHQIHRVIITAIAILQYKTGTDVKSFTSTGIAVSIILPQAGYPVTSFRKVGSADWTITVEKA